MKFIHSADLHLDSPMRGLARYPGAPVDEIRSSSRRALIALVDLAIEERVAFVLIAGDLFDGDWRDYHTGLFFISQMVRLREAAIPVFIIAGNHDARSQITHHLTFPANVRYLAHDRPETVVLDSVGVAIHGQGYVKRWVEENLVPSYSSPLAGYLNIGLLHTSASNAGQHETYAPCSIEDLVNKGYAYWALGHIHERQVLSTDPWVLFSGCLQGRHFQEAGAKGCSLVEANGDEIVRVAAVEVAPVRWKRVQLDCSQLVHAHEVLDVAKAAMVGTLGEAIGRLIAMRVELVGSSAANEEIWAQRHQLEAEIPAVASDLVSDSIWIESVQFRTTSSRRATTGIEGPLHALAQAFARWQKDPRTLAEDLGGSISLEDLGELGGRMPGELGLLALDEMPLDSQRALLSEVESLLTTRLGGIQT